MPMDAGLIGRAVRTRRPVHIGAPADCGDCLRCQAAARAGMPAVLVTPVIRDDRVRLGVRLLRGARRSGRRAEVRKVTLATTFAEGVGLSGRARRARDLVFVRDLSESRASALRTVQELCRGGWR